MAVDVGGYWRINLDVRLGHVTKCPWSIALHHVESAGEKQQAW
jgi:hypothetical protein